MESIIEIFYFLMFFCFLWSDLAIYIFIDLNLTLFFDLGLGGER